MIDSYVIQRSLQYKPNKIIKNNLNKIDSISNVIGNKKITIFKYTIYKDKKRNIMIGKWKSRNIIRNGAIMLSNNNIKSLFTIIKNHKVLGYNNSYYRESYIYSNIDETLKNNFIKMYGTYTNKILGKNFILLKKFNNSSNITKDDLYSIIDNIINIHAFYYNKDNIVKTMKLNNYSTKDYVKCSKTLEVIFDASKEDNIIDYGINNYNLLKDFIKNISKEWSKYENHKTLTHNDFSNRNIYCNHNNIYFYDWELACYQNPEHDLIDILISNLNILTDQDIINIIKYYKRKLYNKIEIKFNSKEYRELLIYNVKEYMVNKLSMLRVYNKNNHMKFIDILSINSNRLLNLLLNEKRI